MDISRFLICPSCRVRVGYRKDYYHCPRCRKSYPLSSSVPVFTPCLDQNKKNQAGIWSQKTYTVNPHTHVFTTIQEHFTARLIKKLPLRPGAVVADIGCFIGEKLWQLPNHVSGIGVDIALPALQAAAQMTPQYAFLAADIEALPFKSASLDGILVFDVLEHVSHLDQAVSELSRVLKPGGLLLIHGPIKDNILSMFWYKQRLFPKLARKDYLDVGHTSEHMPTRYQLNTSLSAHSLQIIKQVPYNSFFVHFWDRELAHLIAWFFHLFIKSSTSQSRPVLVGSAGKLRSVYGKYLVPIFEFLSWPDWLLSKIGIGNTLFILAKKI